MTEDIESLYPEVSEHGSLAAALNAMCGRPDDWSFSNPSPGRLHARAQHDDSMMSVLAGAGRRAFVLDFARRGKGVAQGTTPDLAAVRGVAEAWLGGMPLRELKSQWPFVEYTEVQEVYASGNAADLIEAYWRTLLREVSPGLHSIVTEAHEQPRLRAMFPMESHNRFRVVSDLGKPWDTPYIRLKHPEGFELVSAGQAGEILAEGDARTVIGAYVRALRRE
ncbi:DUF6193 family natural product biosynthesis protein [Streptomyces sp. Ru72]|uniref:DUF6193 family natural product biosynthesis protein n=1 Tax=Streptomyces sp. Ru72 TaxID=2080747 RepID=UPI0011B0CABA|nr:DUF6193 family natural product biosynthesis protein [Streptomyces sp. Ru72]